MTNRVTETVGRAGAYAGEKLHDATDQVKDTAAAAKAAAAEALGTAREKVSDAYSTAREKTGHAYSTAREKTGSAYGAAREKTAHGIEEGPIAALLGGLALGALAGVLLPRTRKEVETLGPIGSKINEAARTAATAARDAGKESLAELGLNRDAAKEKVQQVVDSAVKAASTAGTAAVEAVRKPGEPV